MSFGTLETGAACRAHILALLASGHLTAQDMTLMVGRKIKTVQDHLRTLNAAGDIHVVARIGHNLNMKLYAIGPGPDASNIASRVMEALERRPMTARELCDELDESNFTIRKTCIRLRKKGAKRIYVKDWTRQQSSYNKAQHLYAIGDLPDKPKPRAFSREENSARARKKLRAQLKADPVRYIDFLMIKRKSYARMKKNVARDPFMSQFAGLFGERRAA